MIASMKPFDLSCARAAGSRAAPEATTSMSRVSRVLAQFVSDPCGSMSMTQTFSLMSCAATASDEANVLFPEPPFWVTNAIVRMIVLASTFFVRPGLLIATVSRD